MCEGGRSAVPPGAQAAVPHMHHLPAVRTTFSAEERIFQTAGSPNHFSVPETREASSIPYPF